MSDNETYVKAVRYIGALETLDAAAKAVGCMPCDKMTASLLDDIRRLTNKAVLAAWEYSDQYKPAVGKSE